MSTLVFSYPKNISFPRSPRTLFSSEDKEFFVLDAGHVGLLTGRDAKTNLWPKVSSWLEERSG